MKELLLFTLTTALLYLLLPSSPSPPLQTLATHQHLLLLQG